MRWLSNDVVAKLQGDLTEATAEAPEAADRLDLQGQVIGGRFVVDAWLGSGGMGAIYRGTDRKSGERIVLKIIHPTLVSQSGPGAALTVLKEAVALGRVAERVPPTEHVVRLIETGTFRSPRPIIDSDGVARPPLDLPWLALEFVDGGAEGTTLHERVHKSIRDTGFAFPADRVARAVEHLADGLSSVHDAGVVHRDLKPANVLCTGIGDEEVHKLADFGISRPEGVAATFGGLVVGTPGYAPPELVMLSRPSIGPWTDIFGLASVVFYMLAGQDLFPVRTVRDALRMIRDTKRTSVRDAPRADPDLQADGAACAGIDAAIHRATLARPEERTRSASAFAESILPFLRTSRMNQTGPRSQRIPPPPTSLRDSANAAPRVAAWRWRLRQSASPDLQVHHVAWDDGARCFLATAHGLLMWDGAGYRRAPLPGHEDLPPIRFIYRIAHDQWLVGGDAATFAVCTERGVTEATRGGDTSVRFEQVSGDLNDIAVVVGSRAGASPALYALVGRHWLKPLPVRDAKAIHALTRLDRTRWIVAGEARAGGPYAAIYSPLQWEAARVAAEGAGAMTACSSDSIRKMACAVSAAGAALVFESDRVSMEAIAPHEPASAVTIDAQARVWAGGRGKLWFRSAPNRWACVFEDAQSPDAFVSIFVDNTRVLAVTERGAIIQGEPG